MSDEAIQPELEADTFDALAKILIGDTGEAPRLTGSQAAAFLRANGAQGYDPTGSRQWETSKCLSDMNGTSALGGLIEASVHPRRYVGTDFSAASTAAVLNEHLTWEGYQLEPSGHTFRLVAVEPGVRAAIQAPTVAPVRTNTSPPVHNAVATSPMPHAGNVIQATVVNINAPMFGGSNYGTIETLSPDLVQDLRELLGLLRRELANVSGADDAIAEAEVAIAQLDADACSGAAVISRSSVEQGLGVVQRVLEQAAGGLLQTVLLTAVAAFIQRM